MSDQWDDGTMVCRTIVVTPFFLDIIEDNTFLDQSYIIQFQEVKHIYFTTKLESNKKLHILYKVLGFHKISFLKKL